MVIKKSIQKFKNEIMMYKSLIPSTVFKISFTYTLITLILLTPLVYSVSIIPQEEGFGMNTPAGRGGYIYKITNLASSGTGSLKECIDASGPRVCVFEVSGNIELTQHLKITNPYLTIAGQTAPSPGITIKGAGIVIQAPDILIQHIRVRVGDNAAGPTYDDRDAFKIESKYEDINNVVIDHVSASWALDEVFSTWSYDGKIAQGITVTNSIFSEALYNSKHPDGAHSMGVLIGKNTKDILLNKNILAYNNYRNPLIRDDSTNVIIANNYLYNPGVGSKSKIYFGTTGVNNVAMSASVVGNVFSANPDEYYDNMVYVENGSATNFNLFVDDNLGPLGTSDDWAVVMGRTDSSIRETSAPISVPGLTYLSSSKVKDYVFVNAGARPADRDDVDKRVISNMKSNSGKIINSQNEVGGWPNLAQNYRQFIIPQNPNNDDDNNGYTNLEELLHTYAAQVEAGDVVQIPTPTPEPEPTTITDTTAPLVSSTTLTNLASGTTSTTMNILTDELAYCHYDDTSNIDYLNQKYRFDDVNTKIHNKLLSNLTDGQTYIYYVRCKDLNTPHNYNQKDFIVTFSVDSKVVVVQPTPEPTPEPTPTDEDSIVEESPITEPTSEKPILQAPVKTKAKSESTNGGGSSKKVSLSQVQSFSTKTINNIEQTFGNEIDTINSLDLKERVQDVVLLDNKLDDNIILNTNHENELTTKSNSLPFGLVVKNLFKDFINILFSLFS